MMATVMDQRVREEQAAMAVACPYCNAQPGEQCHPAGQSTRISALHAVRLRAGRTGMREPEPFNERGQYDQAIDAAAEGVDAVHDLGTTWTTYGEYALRYALPHLPERKLVETLAKWHCTSDLGVGTHQCRLSSNYAGSKPCAPCQARNVLEGKEATAMESEL